MTAFKSVFPLFLLVGSIAWAQQTPPPAPTPAPAPMPVETAPAPAGFYYFCQSMNAYYPNTNSCPEGWIAIPVNSPPPMPQNFSPWYEAETPESREIIHSQPNAITLEFLGRALAYSLNYDRAFTEHITVGLGISSWQESWRWSQYQSTVVVLPVYMNYYFSEKMGRGFASAGVDFIHVSQTANNDNSFMNNGAAATLGAGYETRDRSGFLLRIGFYLVAGQPVELSPAVDIGYAF